MPDEFLPQQENQFAAGPDQSNPVDIILGRIGANISAGATGSGVTGSAAWITSVQTNTPSYSFAGVISEVIVFDRKLDDAERNRVYSYLARKYGTTLESRLPDSLHSAHPSTAPYGLTYWDIENHPNNKNLSTIPFGSEFSGLTLETFFSLPDSLYRSTGPESAGDTYSNIGL
jgi:hypothetical protein